METGMLDIEHAAKKKQLLMKHRIQDNASELMKITINSNIKWGLEAKNRQAGKRAQYTSTRLHKAQANI